MEPTPSKSSSDEKPFEVRQSRDSITGETILSLNISACPLEVRVKLDSGEMIVGRYGRCSLPPKEYGRAWQELLKAGIKDLGFQGNQIFIWFLKRLVIVI